MPPTSTRSTTDTTEAPAAATTSQEETAPDAEANAAAAAAAVVPAGMPPPPLTADTTPLTVTELRDHLIALYNTTDSIRKYCRSNGIPSKRTTLSQAMAESGLAKRKQAAFPFDKSILKMVDDYTKTYSSRRSVSAKMSREELRNHLIEMYKTPDSIRKYCKDNSLTSRRSTMTRAFAESGLASRKENREPLDASVKKAIDDYLDKMPSMKDKPDKKPPKIALKATKQSQATNATNKHPPDEVQMEYIRSVLRTTPPGKAIEVMKETSFESALRDVKDPDLWWMANPGGGPPTSVTTTDLLKWTIKRPDVGLCETPNSSGIPVAVEEMAKESAHNERQTAVDKEFQVVNEKIVADFLEKVTDEALKETLKEALKEDNLLDPYKEQLQDRIEGVFKTAVSVTHEGKTMSFDVKVGGLSTVVTAKETTTKKRKAESPSKTEKLTTAKLKTDTSSIAV